MKKTLVVLLSLGMVMAASMSAFALSADFAGKVYYRGWYISNPTMTDKDWSGQPSAAMNDQRFRIYTTFNVVDGLSAHVRMDLAEHKWRAADPGTAEDWVGENLAVDHTYVKFKTAIGTFQVGEQESLLKWGTKFQDASSSRAGIDYENRFGVIRVHAAWQKEKDQNTAWATPYIDPATDTDSDIYTASVRYKGKTLDTGLAWLFARDASKRVSKSYTVEAHALEPYVKTKLGPVDLQAEGFWTFGDAVKYEKPTASKPDQKAEAKGLYVDAKFNVGPAYIGASYIYQSGDDPSTKDKKEGNMAKTFGGGSSLKPGLMMFYSDYTDMAGDYTVYNTSGAAVYSFDDYIQNAKIYKVYGGFAATKKLDFWANFMVMKADTTPTTKYVSDEYGKEFDLTATYKIYDQLTLELAAAYFWTGDFFKGEDSAMKIDNNYFLRSVLELEF